MNERVTEAARIGTRASWLVTRTVVIALPVAIVLALVRPDKFPFPKALAIGIGAPLATFVVYFAFFFLMSITSSSAQVQSPRLRNILWPIVAAALVLFVVLVWHG